MKQFHLRAGGRTGKAVCRRFARITGRIPVAQMTLARRPLPTTMGRMTSSPRIGRLEVVHGSMFAGKTEHLLARLRAEAAAGRRVVAVKHVCDARYAPEFLVTHRGDRFAAIRVEEARAILPRAREADVVAIDEGHFFKRPLLDVVETLMADGKTVLVAGITNDAWGRPFEPMPQLVAMADVEVLKQAPCTVCGAPSPYSQRLTPVGTEFMVGGAGDYEPRCPAHFTALTTPPEPR